jgi:acetoin utilization deacetylase AcuC-like enzyme
MYIIYDDFFTRHNTGSLHPEKPGRTAAIKEALDIKIKSSMLFKRFVEFRAPEMAKKSLICAVHKEDYFEKIKAISASGKLQYIDPDTVVSGDTFDCAVLAAGACIKGIDFLFENAADTNAAGSAMQSAASFFALVRPPGHHAFGSAGSGFCIFNNIAIAAKYAAANYGCKRIAIIDFDVHHGNGTQEIFYEDKNVFYMSLHQYPHYPGSGYWNETGRQKGEGYNLNIPLTAFSGEYDYIEAFTDVILPVLIEYNPGLILVSAGFDGHKDDPLSSVMLKSSSYYKIMKLILFLSSTARLRSKGKNPCNIGIMLEGGYDFNATSQSAVEVIKACIEEESRCSSNLSEDESEPGPEICITDISRPAFTRDRQIRTLYRLKASLLSGGRITGTTSGKNRNTFNAIKKVFAASFRIFSVLCITVLSFLLLFSFAGCRQYDNQMDISYYFKTAPEKAVIDFIYAMENKDADYVYSNFLLESDKRKISREKFIREMSEILSAVKSIAIEKIVYLGYEDKMSKVVLDFKIIYSNGKEGKYKKYIYLFEENEKWKIVFDKTFI